MNTIDEVIFDYAGKIASLEYDNKYEPLTSQQIVMNRTIVTCYKEFIATLQKLKTNSQIDEVLESRK